MLILWVGLGVVVVVALAAYVLADSDEGEDVPLPGAWNKPLGPPKTDEGRLEEQRAASTAPVAVEDVVPASRGADVDLLERDIEARRPKPSGITSDTPRTPRPRKPTADTGTVLHIVRTSETPVTSREVAAQLRGTTPAKVSSILVTLRRDGLVVSETKRNLMVWSAA